MNALTNEFNSAADEVTGIENGLSGISYLKIFFLNIFFTRY